MSVHNLPTEILLKIFTKCDVSDICELALACKRFNSLVHEKLLWLGFCQRRFPGLRFGEGQHNFEEVYRYEVREYSKLPGVWISRRSSDSIAIRMRGSEMLGYTVNLTVEEFGKTPVALLVRQLKVEWDPDTNSWGTLLFRYASAWLPATFTLDLNNSLEFKSSLSLPSNVTASLLLSKISGFSVAAPKLQDVLPQGLFVKSSGRSTICAMVRAAYSADRCSLVIKNEPQNQEIQVSLDGVTDIAMLPHATNQDILAKDCAELSLEDKPLPEYLTQHSGGVLTEHTSTYRAAFRCSMNYTFADERKLLHNHGILIIFNDDFFCFYNCKYGNFRLFFRLSDILSRKIEVEMENERLDEGF